LSNTAVASTDGQSVTVSYRLSSQRCLENGWTVWPPIHSSVHSVSEADDTQSTSDTCCLSDELLQPQDSLYKVGSNG